MIQQRQTVKFIGKSKKTEKKNEPFSSHKFPEKQDNNNLMFLGHCWPTLHTSKIHFYFIYLFIFGTQKSH